MNDRLGHYRGGWARPPTRRSPTDCGIASVPDAAAASLATPGRCPIDQVGGQAVLNGVMLRGPDSWAVAVRDPEGEIQLLRHDLPSPSRWGRVPVLRGVVALVGSLRLGLQALQWSAGVAAGQKVKLGVPGLIAAAVSLPLFVVGPAVAADHLAGGNRLTLTAVHALLEVALLLGYLLAIARNDEVMSFFRFHGAEHKVVNLFERGGPRTVAAALGETTRHPRCGTSFLLLVAVVAAGVSGLIGHLPAHLLIPVRIAALPIVVGLAFELIKLVGASPERWWARPIIAPGLALQAMTTREPSAADLEVALAALEAVAPAEAWAAPVAVGPQAPWPRRWHATRGPLAAR